MGKRHLVAGVLLAASSGASAAKAQETSAAEMIKMGKQTSAYFECAAYAAFAKEGAEHKRLLAAGYEQGLRFISALNSNSEKWPQVSQKISFNFALSLNGPTPDFALGVYWARVLENVLW